MVLVCMEVLKVKIQCWVLIFVVTVSMPFLPFFPVIARIWWHLNLAIRCQHLPTELHRVAPDQITEFLGSGAFYQAVIFPNCKRGPELFLEPTWVSDSGNYTFSCSLTQRNMSSDCPPNVPSPPNSDGDEVAHSSAVSRILFDIFGEQRKGKERWDHSGSERARAGKERELREEETDLCNNVLAAACQSPHVRKAGLHFTGTRVAG